MDRKHTYELLEFNKVLTEVSKFATTRLAREVIENLEAVSDKEKVVSMLDITAEGYSIISKNDDFAFTGKTDIKAHLEHVKKNGFLVGEQLLDIVNHIENIKRLKKYFDGITSVSKEYFAKMMLKTSLLENVETELDRCVDNSGNIKDNASFEIRKYKKSISSKEVEVRNKINQVMNAKSKMLSENIVTIRNNRQVLAVKQEYKHVFGGLIHDESLSGQTIYVEPEECVSINNSIAELKVKLKNEIEKILIYLSKTINNTMVEFEQNLYAFTEIDLMFTKAKYALANNCYRLDISDNINLIAAKHPLISPLEVIENDIVLNENAMIITGANTGGKTVTLKTVGLYSLMNQCGLFVPCRDKSSLPIFDKVFAQMGDNQSLDNNLSTFSAHIMELKFILDNYSKNDLILLDEVGSGTNPNEGASLAIAIIDTIASKGAKVIATTHYNELKEYALKTPYVSSASVKFDEVNLVPTYKLMLNTVGISYALLISERLGVCKEVIDKARQVLIENTDENMLILDRINEEQTRLSIKEEQLEKMMKEQDEKYQRLKIKESSIEDNADIMLKRAKEEANRIINEAVKKSDLIVKELSKDQKHHQARKRIEELENQKHQLEEKINNDNMVLQAGDDVLLLPFETKAKVVNVKSDNKIEILIGSIKSIVLRSDLIFANRSKKKKTAVVSKTISKKVKSKVDLRGLRVVEAREVLDNYFDDVKLSKLHEITIVHGYGTGAVRKMVFEYLNENGYEYRSGQEGEGGSGATVVKLNN